MVLTRRKKYCLAVHVLLQSLYAFGTIDGSVAFSPVVQPLRGEISTPFGPRRSSRTPQLQEQREPNPGDNGSDLGLIDRFLNPRIDDPALPLTEAGLVQVVGPTLQLFWLVSLDSPYPSWAQPLYDYTFAARGAFLAPTLIHGSGLACCWLLGCLAARAWERPAFRASTDGDYKRVVSSTIQAGAFACGMLILATQFDLYREMGEFVQVGDSPDTDLRIYRALVEVINDIFFEFIVLMPWRLFRSNFD